MLVLRQQNQMVSATVSHRVVPVLLAAVSHIHLASEDGLERLQAILRALAVHLHAVVEQLLDAIHVAVIGESHSSHAVFDGFVHQLADGSLTVEQ